MRWHGELDAAGGGFDHLSGTAGISFSTAKDRFSARASGLHSDRYVDPPVFQNYTNQGNSGGFLAQYEREFEANDPLRVTFLHDTLGYIVPNDLVQQNQLIGPQRQEASSTENGDQVYFEHSISPTLFLTVSGGARVGFALRSNLLSGLGQGPITGGLFIGSAAQGVLTDTSKFAISQDQRNTLRARVRFHGLVVCVATQYGSGLPADPGDNTNVPSLITQFGAQVVSRVNLERGRVDPNFSLDLATGAELYRRNFGRCNFNCKPRTLQTA